MCGMGALPCVHWHGCLAMCALAWVPCHVCIGMACCSVYSVGSVPMQSQTTMQMATTDAMAPSSTATGVRKGKMFLGADAE